MKHVLSLILVLIALTTISAQTPHLSFETLYETDFFGNLTGIVETQDKGFVLVGTNTPGNGNGYAFVIRTDSLGNNVWQNNYGTAWDGIHTIVSAKDVICSNDGNYIIVGEGDSEMVTAIEMDIQLPFHSGYISKIDDTGNVIWEKYIHTSEDYRQRCAFWAIDQLNNGNYILGGYHDIGGESSENPPRWNGYIIVIDEDGELINEISYETFEAPSLDWFYDIEATSDGGFIATGFYDDDLTTNYISNGLVVKFDENGVKQWHYIYDTPELTTFIKLYNQTV